MFKVLYCHAGGVCGLGLGSFVRWLNGLWGRFQLLWELGVGLLYCCFGSVGLHCGVV